MQTSPPASPPLRLERAQGAPLTAAAQSRAQWVDAAKGMGIAMVVFGHAVGGMLMAGLAPAGSAWATAFYLVYTFHMPLFFLLSGLFVQRRLAADPQAFVGNAFVRVAWPYLLWSVIQLLVIDALGTVVNRPIDVDAWRLVTLLWEPTSQFWFLQSLLLLLLLARWWVPHLGAWSLLGVMLLARGAVELVELPSMLSMTARYGLFYAIGLLAGPALLRKARAPSAWQAGWLGALASAVWSVAALAAYRTGEGYLSLVTFPAAAAGSTAVIALSMLPRVQALAWLSAMGRASMAIFLLHVLFVAGTRIALHKLLGIDSVALVVLLACMAGVAGPLLLRTLAQRLGATRVLGLG